jgi:hypothetical protein
MTSIITPYNTFKNFRIAAYLWVDARIVLWTVIPLHSYRVGRVNYIALMGVAGFAFFQCTGALVSADKKVRTRKFP